MRPVLWLLALVVVPYLLLTTQVAVSMLGPVRWLIGAIMAGIALWRLRLWSARRAESVDSSAG